MKYPVERKFFNISQVCFFVVASLSLLTAACCLIYGLILHNAAANESMAQPSPTYEQLKRDKAAEKAELERLKAQKDTQVTHTAEKPPMNTDAIPVEFIDILNSIEKTLVSFSRKSGQVAVSDKLRLLIFRRADTYTRYVSVSNLLRQLDNELKVLERDADHFKDMQPEAPDYITWQTFLEYFFAQVDKSIREQHMRIENEKKEALIKQQASGIVLYGAAGAFFIFIFFTMFLVLLSTERNTFILRKIQEGLEGTSKNS